VAVATRDVLLQASSIGVMLNLDRFRNLNAKYGLRTGDLVLKRMAERPKLCTRGSDSIARLGGDEFSVLLEDASREGRCHDRRAACAHLARATASDRRRRGRHHDDGGRRVPPV